MKTSKKRRTLGFSLRQQRASWGCGWRAQAATSPGPHCAPTVQLEGVGGPPPRCRWVQVVASDADGTVHTGLGRKNQAAQAALARSARCDPHPTQLTQSTQPSLSHHPIHQAPRAPVTSSFSPSPIALPATTGLCIRHRPPRTHPVSCPNGFAIAHPLDAPPEISCCSCGIWLAKEDDSPDRSTPINRPD